MQILPKLMLCLNMLMLARPISAAPELKNVPTSEAKMLLENEKNTISIFQNNVNSVVNITNIRKVRHPFGWLEYNSGEEIPAGMGSGFVWDEQGHIVTNYHVVAEGDAFTVTFNKDQTQYKATLVGAEPKKDIAVLKVEKLPKGVNPVTVGTSKDVIVGQKALAIGSPFGLDSTITEGIVSAIGRKIQGVAGVTIHNMIQTDCAINRGNSGGPLINSRGELIGINTVIFSTSGSSAGIGFAVPVDSVKLIVPELIKHGKIMRPGLGLSLLDDRLKQEFGIDKGIVIRDVPRGTAADKAGLQGIRRDNRGRYMIGDIILKIDSNVVNSYDDIFHALEAYKIGDLVEITYQRDGKARTTKINLQQISYE